MGRKKKMYGTRLVMKDGTRIEDGRAGSADGALWCYFAGYTMAQAAAIFLDPQKTEEITFEYGEMKDKYEGFTECRHMDIQDDGSGRVCLMKPAEVSAE